MDAGVYPDKEAQEVLKSFVCIRVDFDRNPELVKKHGVGALADVRLLDPTGKEHAKLVGFTSVKRLVTAARALLDQLAGKTPAGGGSGEAVKIDPSRATPEAIDAAVKRGLAYVRAALPKAGKSAVGFAADDEVLYTYVACGVDANDAGCAKLIESVAKAPLGSTYQAAFRALALARLDPKGHREAIEACARFLLRTQLASGQWSYGSEGSPPQIGDNSNTAYGVLGLAACRKAGVDVPEAAIDKAAASWLKSQNADGGWGYRSDREKESYASMTESGYGSLGLSAKLLGRGAASPEALEKAAAWLKANYSASENLKSAYQQGRLLYHLYALERVASLLGSDKIGEHEWHREGAAFLVATQRSDGSWDDGADTPLPNTCFALLFLSRSTQFLR